MATAAFLVFKESKKKDLNQDTLVDIMFYVLIFGILGARTYYVLFNLDYYLSSPLEILKIWNGGLAIHGGLAFGLITILMYCKKYRLVWVLELYNLKNSSTILDTSTHYNFFTSTRISSYDGGGTICCTWYNFKPWQ